MSSIGNPPTPESSRFFRERRPPATPRSHTPQWFSPVVGCLLIAAVKTHRHQLPPVTERSSVSGISCGFLSSAFLCIHGHFIPRYAGSSAEQGENQATKVPFGNSSVLAKVKLSLTTRHLASYSLFNWLACIQLSQVYYCMIMYATLAPMLPTLHIVTTRLRTTPCVSTRYLQLLHSSVKASIYACWNLRGRAWYMAVHHALDQRILRKDGLINMNLPSSS